MLEFIHLTALNALFVFICLLIIYCFWLLWQ
jgi:hypothetical protein